MGVMKIDTEEYNIDLLTVSGHKSLMGPPVAYTHLDLGYAENQYRGNQGLIFI